MVTQLPKQSYSNMNTLTVLKYIKGYCIFRFLKVPQEIFIMFKVHSQPSLSAILVFVFAYGEWECIALHNNMLMQYAAHVQHGTLPRITITITTITIEFDIAR